VISIVVAFFTFLGAIEGFVTGVKYFFDSIPWVGGVLATSAASGYLALGALVVLVILNTTLWKRPSEEPVVKEVTLLGKIEDSEIKLVKGNIQETNGLGRESVILLPANTTFMDDCITDKNSALGAYFMENYPGKNEQALTVMQKELELRGYSRNPNGDYSPGATILMPAPFDSPVKLLISGTTVRRKEEGIIAEPSSITEAIHNAFAITADMKISRLRMPVLGSGHGGMNLASAVNLLVHTIKYYLGKYHHVKSVELVVREVDASKLRLINAGRNVVVVEGSES